jgi:lipopolysaccharide transport system ATP-binding protein
VATPVASSSLHASQLEREKLISVRNISRKFCRDLRRSLWYTALDTARSLFRPSRAGAALRAGEFWALKDVSFEVGRGESLGVMGLNGAGKSTLLRLMLGSLRLSQGEIVTSGRCALLSDHGLGFDPRLSGRENVYMTAAVLDISRQSVNQAFDQIVAFAKLEEFIDSPMRAYSSGMRARLGFSVAMHLEPDILLVDEVLAVGDIGFQRQCIHHAQRYLKDGGSLVLVSHNPHLVQFICDRCLVLDHGAVVFDGDVVEGVARYLQAACTPPGDFLAFDPALAGEAAQVPRPVSKSAVEILDFGIEQPGFPGLCTGKPARVYVRYLAHRDVDIRWGFCLLTGDAATVITCEGLMEPIAIIAGEGELAGTIARLPLASRRYTLRVAIMDPHTELPLALGGFYDLPRSFAVEATNSRRDNYRMVTGDLIALEDVHWDRMDASTAKPPTRS